MFVQRRKNLIACNEIEWRNKKCQLFRQNLFGEVSHFLEVDSQLVLQHFSQLKQSRTREVPVLAVIYIMQSHHFHIRKKHLIKIKEKHLIKIRFKLLKSDKNLQQQN